MKSKKQEIHSVIPADTPEQLGNSLRENLVIMRQKCSNTSDLNVREIMLGGVPVAVVAMEGLVSLQLLGENVVEPLIHTHYPEKIEPKELYHFIEERSLMSMDIKDFYSFEECFQFLMSGFVVILIDQMSLGIAIGAQGYNFRSISEPSSEVNELGSREGFTEPIRINLTMVRRRIKSPKLRFELLSLGKKSKTDICLIYMEDRVNPLLVQQVRRRLQRIDLELILTSGYLRPFLEGKRSSLFSDVGHTERPDTVCAKIQEGRIGILIDGTPFCLIVPYLFSENFQSLDDYCHKPYYAFFIRVLKYISFLIAILLPGVYVAVATFHPELFPDALLFNIVSAQETTPFPLMVEALLIHFIYEIMREAGLRLPRPVGHAVSIVGALVIGDAAVTAGLIGSPMVMVVALTAIASFVVPSLQEPVSLLRFAFIVIGGMWGLYGIALAGAMVMTNACALTAFGVPFLSPIAPFDRKAMRDTIFRAGFPSMQKEIRQIKDLNGVHETQEAFQDEQ